MDIDQLRQELNERIVIVTFTKVDGSERRMHCTTNLELIPPSKLPFKREILNEDPNLKVFRVFDMQVQDWRSFRIDSIKAVE